MKNLVEYLQTSPSHRCASRASIRTKHFLNILALGLLASVCANAGTIVEASGATNPLTEGFVVPGLLGQNNGNGTPVTNDLGLGINAWNVNGSWCCSGYAYILSTADQAALDAGNWIFTVEMRDLSTTTTNSGYGPNSYGGVATIGVDGMRFSIDLHSDGQGNQILAPDPFAAGPTYTIAGLGTNYATIQIAYDAATKTADYYVNGTEVLSGVTGFANFYEPWVSFGGQNSNFNLVQLDADATIPSSAPEPSSLSLLGFALIALPAALRQARKRHHRSAL
jgi:hypothetical protein